MKQKSLIGLGCVLLLAFVAWVGESNLRGDRPRPPWDEILPGVFRSQTSPASYVFVRDGKALVIDAVLPPSALDEMGIKQIDMVLLTHHHRDTIANVDAFLKAKIPVRAAKTSAPWLTVDGVEKYWTSVLPLRSSNTAYFVVPVGFESIDCSLEDGQKIEWNTWNIQVVGTPGHSRDHLSFAFTREKEAPIVCCGDAFCTTGKLWTPYTSDWDHWTDMGLKPTSESLIKLAKLAPRVLLPAHGPMIDKECVSALETTSKAISEVGFLRSYQRFTERIGDVPQYKFLVPKEQIASSGDKPWAQVSDHLYITGNTYVLVSKTDNAMLVIDPWAERSVKQIDKLRQDQKLGNIEIVWFSHAHYDHFDGLYSMAGREGFQVWALDKVAEPLEDPFRWRAPFLDARPIKFERKFKEGDTANWREYRFRFVHLPGQTLYTMGVETSIDGKKCMFTADNFFHHEQFSGTGGWMGLNRSSPGPYGTSAKKVLDFAPEWVLAEHGGPYEFSAEDYRRRVEWGKVGVKAADVISPTGSHLHDWNPHHIAVERLVHKAKAGDTIKATLKLSNHTNNARSISAFLEGRGIFVTQSWTKSVPANGVVEVPFAIELPKSIAKGRHIFAVRNSEDEVGELVDAFMVIEIE